MYNHYEAFTEAKPQTICPACAQDLAIAAVLRYHTEHPEIEGDVEVRINISRRVVVVNAIPIEEYSWSELGFSGGC